MQLVEGPFERFAAGWRFHRLEGDNATGCRIAFFMDCEFSSKLLATTLEPLFERIADTMVDAFVKRAEARAGEMRGKIRVEVIYALPGRAQRVALELDVGATVIDAIRASGLVEKHPEIDLARDGAGVFGRIVKLAAPLEEGDRVELYRPLIADPKEARKARAKAAPSSPRRRGPRLAK
jgi:putative ubiquitin-RnfH superfamily antitoxin RatB of RatAB toxin-antitoxin module